MGTETRIVGYFELKPEHSDLLDIFDLIAENYFDDDRLAADLNAANLEYPSKLWAGERTGRMLIMEKSRREGNKLFFHTWPFKSYDQESALFLELMADKVTTNLEIFVYVDTGDTGSFYKGGLTEPTEIVEWENWPVYIDRLESLI